MEYRAVEETLSEMAEAMIENGDIPDRRVKN
jgi:hypothetical protein